MRAYSSKETPSSNSKKVAVAAAVAVVVAVVTAAAVVAAVDTVRLDSGTVVSNSQGEEERLESKDC